MIENWLFNSLNLLYIKTMNPEILNRKGARKVNDVPANILVLLNSGQIQSVNLTEWLAIDHIELVESVFSELGVTNSLIIEICKEMKSQKKLTSMLATKIVGQLLYDFYKDSKEGEEVFHKMSHHLSDTIRGYSTYLSAFREDLSFQERLDKTLHLINDPHFGVREIIWMALRFPLIDDVQNGIDCLAKWSTDKEENVRRFISEVSRPRGVWCKHIDELKEQPELALPILEPLKSDPSKYVQDSVGNWLNDASKSAPDFVIDLCDKWEKESPTKETQKIIKRAKRTLLKQAR